MIADGGTCPYHLMTVYSIGMLLVPGITTVDTVGNEDVHGNTRDVTTSIARCYCTDRKQETRMTPRQAKAAIGPQSTYGPTTTSRRRTSQSQSEAPTDYIGARIRRATKGDT